MLVSIYKGMLAKRRRASFLPESGALLQSPRIIRRKKVKGKGKEEEEERRRLKGERKKKKLG